MDTVKQRIAGITVENPIFSDVFEKNSAGKIILPDNIDLPVVMKHYPIKQEVRSGQEILLKLQNNHPFLEWLPYAKGKVYIFAAPLADTWSLFPKHMIFVPTLYKMALLSNPRNQLYYFTGESSTIDILADSVSEANLYKIRMPGTGFEVIPEIRKFGTKVSIITHDQIRDAGLYTIVRGEKPVGGLAFNYNRKESDLTCFTRDELEKQIGRLHLKDIHILKDSKRTLTREIQDFRQGTQLWRWFILLALFFIACEIALIRLFK